MTYKIHFLTSTRAEFGVLLPVIRQFAGDKRFDTQIVACGTHLSREFGYTVDEIKQEYSASLIEIPTLVFKDGEVCVPLTFTNTMNGYLNLIENNRPDCLMVLGDRYEILGAVQAAFFQQIPIAHIHGGEVTTGAMDDSIRHCISKLANFHFPVTETFRCRLIQLGETPSNIFKIVSPGVENAISFGTLERLEIEQQLNIDLSQTKHLAIVTYHPVTRPHHDNENDIHPLITAIEAYPDTTFVITYPNADGLGASFIKQFETLSDFKNIILIPSLGAKRYFSLLKYSTCVIGNSSSGIVEVPSTRTATINIGSRQAGRPQATSVVNTLMDSEEIVKAIELVQSETFQEQLISTVNPYWEVNDTHKITDVLAERLQSPIPPKVFQDLS